MFEKAFNQHGNYKLSFGALLNNQFYPYPKFETLAIRKKEMIVKNAWEIGINDIEQVAIRKDDDPWIPEGVVDAPYLEVIKMLDGLGIK